MRIYLQTRSRYKDYTFVGMAPESRWWREDFSEYTSFEDPTILVRSKGREWMVYLSGVPSVRKDDRERVIRYTLVLEGSSMPGEKSVEKVLSLLDAWLSDIGEQKVNGKLQSALDAVLKDEFVQGLMENEDKEEVNRQLQERLEEVWGRLPSHTVKAEDKGHESWFGDVRSERARSSFLSRSTTLLTGREGEACLVNLISTEEHAQELSGSRDGIAILFSETGRDPRPHIVELPPKKKVPSPPPAGSPPPEADDRGRRRRIVAAALLLVSVTILWWIASRRGK